MSCIFCDELKPEQILAETAYFKIVLDIDPIQTGHLLLISREHWLDLRELPQAALLDLLHIEQQLLSLLETFPEILGGTLIQNNGRTMDPDTHFHVHLVPRYAGDAFWAKQAAHQHSLPLAELRDKLKRSIHKM